MMNNNHSARSRALFVGASKAVRLGTLVVAASAGCSQEGPDLAEVRGVIRLDGDPLPGALIRFQPMARGTYASAVTDENGEYRLQYNFDRHGAMIGEHTITISTSDVGGPERVPPRYNSRTELTRTVTDGKNVVDFDLESGGFGKTRSGTR